MKNCIILGLGFVLSFAPSLVLANHFNETLKVTLDSHLKQEFDSSQSPLTSVFSKQMALAEKAKSANQEKIRELAASIENGIQPELKRLTAVLNTLVQVIDPLLAEYRDTIARANQLKEEKEQFENGLLADESGDLTQQLKDQQKVFDEFAQPLASWLKETERLIETWKAKDKERDMLRMCKLYYCDFLRGNGDAQAVAHGEEICANAFLPSSKKTLSESPLCAKKGEWTLSGGKTLQEFCGSLNSYFFSAIWEFEPFSSADEAKQCWLLELKTANDSSMEK
ncbi:MAG: hypothetical protein HYW48_07860 [Deltaproteobacteria bacterium]|nr:hypothetical protein [Deltaproteobacteria bacterium]